MNLNELKYEIIRNGFSIPSLAKKIGISKKTLYTKLSGKGNFKQNEIAEISKHLNLDKEQILQIFFANKVS